MEHKPDSPQRKTTQLILDHKGLRVALRTTCDREFRDDRASFFQVMVAGEYRELLHTLRPGDTVIDCGANIGCFSLLAAKEVGPHGRVYALEPEPSNFRQLCLNIGLNQLSNIFPLQLGIYGESGRSMRFLGGGVTGSISESGDIWITTISLGDLAERYQLRSIRALKMDIEGGEYFVFREVGISEVLSSIDMIGVELHSRECYDVVVGALRRARFVMSPALRERDFFARLIRALTRIPFRTISLYGVDLLPVAHRIVRGLFTRRQIKRATDPAFEACLVFARRSPSAPL